MPFSLSREEAIQSRLRAIEKLTSWIEDRRADFSEADTLNRWEANETDCNAALAKAERRLSESLPGITKLFEGLR